MKPQIIDRKTENITVQVHMGKINLYFDTDKWKPYFGLGDSGSSMNITFKPCPKSEGTSQ